MDDKRQLWLGIRLAKEAHCMRDSARGLGCCEWLPRQQEVRVIVHMARQEVGQNGATVRGGTQRTTLLLAGGQSEAP